MTLTVSEKTTDQIQREIDRLISSLPGLDEKWSARERELAELAREKEDLVARSILGESVEKELAKLRAREETLRGEPDPREIAKREILRRQDGLLPAAQMREARAELQKLSSENYEHIREVETEFRRASKKIVALAPMLDRAYSLAAQAHSGPGRGAKDAIRNLVRSAFHQYDAVGFDAPLLGDRPLSDFLSRFSTKKPNGEPTE